MWGHSVSCAHILHSISVLNSLQYKCLTQVPINDIYKRRPRLRCTVCVHLCTTCTSSVNKSIAVQSVID